MVSGYVGKTICYLLMEDGQLTLRGLCGQATFYATTANATLGNLLARGIVQREKKSEDGAHRVFHYGLTSKGIEGAQYIERDEIEEYLRSEK